MDTRSPDELNTLKRTLHHLLSVFSQDFSNLNFEFLPTPSRDNLTPGFKPVAEARIDVGYADPLFLRIERDDENTFRICLPSEKRESFNTCSHILLVPKGTEGKFDMWRVDQNALKQTARGRQFIENYKSFGLTYKSFGLTTDENIPAKVTIVSGLILSALLPLIQTSLTTVIARPLVANATNKRRKELEEDYTP